MKRIPWPSKYLVALLLAAAVMLPIATHAQCLLHNYLVAWWSANDGSEDHSGLNNDAVMMNGAELGHGISWWGFCFDGVDDYVTVPHHVNQNLGAGFTIDAWVSMNTYGHGWPIAQKRSVGNVGGFTLETTHSPSGNDFGLQFVAWIGGVPRTLVTPANVMTIFTWRHVAATYDGAVMRIYVDGVEKGNLPVAGSIDPSSEPLVMGQNVTAPSAVMNACIDEVHMFNKALTQTEIQWIIAQDFWGICPTPVGPGEGRIALAQNYPNPFNPSTVIEYELSEALDVTLSVYDASGRHVRSLVREHMPAGANAVRWDGKDDGGHAVATGVYFYRLQAGGVTQTRKMVLLK